MEALGILGLIVVFIGCAIAGWCGVPTGTTPEWTKRKYKEEDEE